MIRLDNISKQHGHQILFIDASMALQKGEKVGPVGPNGAGKTTVFRMIAPRPAISASLRPKGLLPDAFAKEVQPSADASRA